MPLFSGLFRDVYVPRICDVSVPRRYFNVQYIKGYMVSGEGRLASFYSRTSCFKGLLYGAAAGMACAAADVTGALVSAPKYA